MQTEKDYYGILGVPETATDDDIRNAYRALVRRYQADADQDSGAGERLREAQEAYETLNNPTERQRYDQQRFQAGRDQSSTLSLRATASHKSLLAMPDEQAYYVLVEAAPAGDLPSSRLPLNLCLVLDRSTSMQGMRLQQVKEATRQIIDKLQPEDALSLVVFSDRAEVLLPSQRNIDKAMAKSIASTIQPSGGTEMLQGLSTGLKEVERYQSDTSVNHIILLTDGQTYGDEQGCLEQADWARMHQISLSTMGIGSDWNEDLLDQMAARSGGTSTYIDSPRKVIDIFKDTMRNLGMVVARQLVMTLDPSPGVRLQESFQITPHIRRLEVQGTKAALGPLGTGQGKSLLLEFRVQNLSPGDQRLTRIMIEGDVPGQANRRSWEWVELTAHVSETPDQSAEIPPAIVTVLGKLAIFKMQEKAMADLEAGEISTATQRLETMATRLLNLGETDLARAALLEAGRLARTGDLSAEGRKKIRYGTRALSILPKEIHHD